MLRRTNITNYKLQTLPPGRQVKKSNSGFSLIEVLVSMAIFSLIIGGVVLFSVRSIEANTKSRAMQNSIDNARFAIESVNKKIRTSHGINGDFAAGSNDFDDGIDRVFIIDNVDAFKYCYKFTAANTLAVSKISPTDGSYGGTDDCRNGGAFDAGFSDIVGDGTTTNISGSFFVKETDAGAEERGFVRTSITIEYNDASLPPAERDKITIQSSVSVRDY